MVTWGADATTSMAVNSSEPRMATVERCSVSRRKVMSLILFVSSAGRSDADAKDIAGDVPIF